MKHIFAICMLLTWFAVYRHNKHKYTFSGYSATHAQQDNDEVYEQTQPTIATTSGNAQRPNGRRCVQFQGHPICSPAGW